MKEPLLKIVDLDIGYTKAAKRFLVQSKLNLAINGGELICLIGPNGVGKSTLLKTLGRILPSLSGEIKIENKELSSISFEEFSRKIGLVLTEHIDIPHMKAMDIISMGRYPYTGFWGKLGKNDLEIVKSVAKKVGLANLLSRQFVELSDGEKQKVMIAKVLAQQTPLMLLDEPTAFLDFPTKSSLLVMLRKLAREQNIGVVLSTHDIELALKTADQIWLFPEHNKMINGVPEDLVLQGDILEVFQNSEMTFDLTTGHFEKVFTAKRNVEVSGVDERAYWLKKALIRNEIQSSTNTDWRIECATQFEIYHKEKLVKKVDSIEEVLKYLKIQ